MASTRLFPPAPKATSSFNNIFRLKKLSDGVTAEEHAEMKQLAKIGKQGIFVYKADSLQANEKGFEICLNKDSVPQTALDVYRFAMNIYKQINHTMAVELKFVMDLLKDAEELPEARQDLFHIKMELEYDAKVATANSF